MKRADIVMEAHGLVVLLRAMTGRGRTWLTRHLGLSPRRWVRNAVSIDPALLASAIGAAERNGLVCEGEFQRAEMLAPLELIELPDPNATRRATEHDKDWPEDGSEDELCY